MKSKDIVIAFWSAMATNDFVKASQWLSPDFEGFWPQSREKIIGRDNFSAVNSNYPVEGKWKFEIHSIVNENPTVVTDVTVSDKVQSARVITFHTVENGLITKQTEFWPSAMIAQAWRTKWVKLV
ncbi:nuclear transport factor 2 family protein [Vibrio coralliilyticus]|uniref:nuclear transport factor 2 family protein n=1 Tax=Vibrio coralliilyticus TaxID=190893 RepID=UPI000C16F5F5|nr:nuclear transport factor 2 family protein [Vibrio coralliilyticus]